MTTRKVILPLVLATLAASVLLNVVLSVRYVGSYRVLQSVCLDPMMFSISRAEPVPPDDCRGEPLVIMLGDWSHLFVGKAIYAWVILGVALAAAGLDVLYPLALRLGPRTRPTDGGIEARGLRRRSERGSCSSNWPPVLGWRFILACTAASGKRLHGTPTPRNCRLSC